MDAKEFYAEITPNENFTNHYALVGVKEFAMFDGTAWEGTITANGKKVGTVSCHGDGGCYGYWFEDKTEETLFKAAVQLAYLGREMVDVEEDCFINYLDMKNLVTA